jgi:hypothetical protein
MRSLCFLLVPGLMTLVTTIENADARVNRVPVAQTKQRKSHAVHGVVVNVQHHKNGTGSIMIKRHHHKKKNAAGQNVNSGNIAEMSFKVVPATQFFNHGRPANFAAIRDGEHVVVHTLRGHPHEAARVDIVGKVK